MSLLFEKGTFAKVSSAVSDNQTVSMTGALANDLVKAIILFTSGEGSGDSPASDAKLAVGISDGTNEYAVAGVSEDGVGTTNTGRYNSAKALTLLNTTPALRAECGVTSIATPGEFDLNWSTNDTGVDLIHYVAIGGDDLESAKVGTFTAKTSSGDQSTTGVNFKPDALFMLSSHDTAIGSAVSDANILSFGMAVSDTHEAAVASGDLDNVVTTEAARAGYGSHLSDRTDGYCIWFMTNKSGALASDGFALFKSMDADGFTMNWFEAAGAAWHIGYLALRGGQYSVDGQASAAGLVSTTVGFEPKGILTMNATARNAGSLADHYALGIGAADSGINEGISSVISKNNVGTSEADRYQKTDKVDVQAFTGPSIFREADLNAFLNVGYEYNWDGGSAWVFALCMGDARPHTGPALGSVQPGVY